MDLVAGFAASGVGAGEFSWEKENKTFGRGLIKSGRQFTEMYTEM